MRRGASGAADASRRMIKHYRGKLRQSKENVVGSHSAADMAIGSESVFIDTPMEYAFSPVETAARNEVGNRTISPQTRGGTKSANAAPQERGRQKVIQDAKAAYRRNLAEKEQRNAAPLLPRRAAGAQRQIRSRSPRLQSSKAPHQKSEGYPARTAFTHQKAEPFGRHSLRKASCRKQSRQPSEGCSGRCFRNRRRVAAKLRKS